MKAINVLSLFDGMSCGQKALERAGIPVKAYYASEIDKYAIKVTQANYPNTIQMGDIRGVRASMFPSIDLILAGSPCQGFSFAGKQLNFEDERSALFFEFIRLLKDLKPKYFLLENVVMSEQSNDVISSILGELYPECVTQRDMFRPGRLEPIQINSALVSAQNRERLYWTNIPGIEQPKDKGILLEDVLECGSNTVNQRGRGNNPGGDRENKSLCMGASAWQQNVKVIEQKSKTVRSSGRGSNDRHEWDKVGTRRLTPIECERLQTVPDNYTNHVSNSQRYKMLGNGWTVDVIAHILGCIQWN